MTTRIFELDFSSRGRSPPPADRRRPRATHRRHPKHIYASLRWFPWLRGDCTSTRARRRRLVAGVRR
jgi:hypothetical protein